MDRPSYHKDLDRLLSELGFSPSEEQEPCHYQAPESPKRAGFRRAQPTTESVEYEDVNTWTPLSHVPTGWSVFCSPLDATHPTPRLLISAEGETEALYTLPFSFTGDEPPVLSLDHNQKNTLTKLEAGQGVLVLTEGGEGVCVGSTERGVVELTPLARLVLSSTGELTRLAEGRAPAWTLDALREASTPLKRALSLGALTRYLPPLAQEACGSEGEDPARVLLFDLIEELEGWELTSERAGLIEVEALHKTLDLFLGQPCEAHLSRLILDRERVAQRCAAEELVGFSGPLSEAAARFDQRAEQALSARVGDPTLQALPRLSDPSLQAALTARAADWWLLFAER